ncbi:hypothetical protein CEXT_385991 [Caerostris extrusa]|uniref:Uncharacterized protein n=1 Tax=Caerostris extrusa TaxID=172846 RepID=A0AAV4YAF1_CAEEX|nr:hypothetical protein CEXT_385991 [Caerostris extrusa]
MPARLTDSLPTGITTQTPAEDPSQASPAPSAVTGQVEAVSPSKLRFRRLNSTFRWLLWKQKKQKEIKRPQGEEELFLTHISSESNYQQRTENIPFCFQNNLCLPNTYFQRSFESRLGVGGRKSCRNSACLEYGILGTSNI